MAFFAPASREQSEAARQDRAGLSHALQHQHIAKSVRLKELFDASPVLLLTVGFMALDLLACIFGLLFDRTVILGAYAWAKPAKFAISTLIYALSLALVLRYTLIWKKTLRLVEVLTGLTLTVEIILIDLQAIRHTTSHFNIATSFDRNVFAVMGVAIAILWLSSIVLTIATFLTRYASPALTIAVRYGMVMVVLGAGTGAIMVAPSHAQLEAAQRTHLMTISGSHTVGGEDGGEGIPVLGWSTQHGDIRVSHFVGLHTLQLVTLLALFMHRRRTPQRKAERIILVALLSSGTLFLATLAEALMKVPIINHGAVVTTVSTLWLILSLFFFYYATRAQASDSVPGLATTKKEVNA